MEPAPKLLEKPQFSTMDPVDEFFASFPTFNYKRSASSPQEFRRMCSHFNWRKRPNGTYPAERQEASKVFRIAMVRSFNQNFGEGVEVKRAWVHLCTTIMVEPIPTSIADMKNTVLRTHVNLSDLLDGARTGAPVRIFATQTDLADYTRTEGRYFPKEDAYAGGLLKYLLREIDNTYGGKRGKRRSESKRYVPPTHTKGPRTEEVR